MPILEYRRFVNFIAINLPRVPHNSNSLQAFWKCTYDEANRAESARVFVLLEDNTTSHCLCCKLQKLSFPIKQDEYDEDR